MVSIMTVAQVKRQALTLGPAQRIRLVQDIWDSLVKEPKGIPIPDHHKRLIEERLAEHEAAPNTTFSLSEAKHRIRTRLSRRRKP